MPNPKKKKVLSVSSMGIYKYMFNSNNQREILDYCNSQLGKLEDSDTTPDGSTAVPIYGSDYYAYGYDVAVAQMLADELGMDL